MRSTLPIAALLQASQPSPSAPGVIGAVLLVPPLNSCSTGPQNPVEHLSQIYVATLVRAAACEQEMHR